MTHLVHSNYILDVGGTLEKIAGKINVEATNGDLQLISNKKIVSEGTTAEYAEPTSGLIDSADKSITKLLYFVRLFVFQRENGAFGLGHVGMALEINTVNGKQVKTRYHLGGVENWAPAYASAHIDPGKNNDGWYQETDSFKKMLAIARENKKKGYEYNYDNYKYTLKHVESDERIIMSALNKMKSFKDRGYDVATNNCMDACYEVLRLFDGSESGHETPWPSTNPRPNGWFAALTKGWSDAKSTGK